jgi:hypothetical protein
LTKSITKRTFFSSIFVHPSQTNIPHSHGTKEDPQSLIYLEDASTGLEFTVPRFCLPKDEDWAAKIDWFVTQYPGRKIEVQIHSSTPAGVFLYSHALLFRKIIPHHAQMAWAGFVRIHKELKADGWMSFLLAGLLVAREEEDPWFEKLVVDEIVAFTGEALRTPSVVTKVEAGATDAVEKVEVDKKVEIEAELGSEFEGDE